MNYRIGDVQIHYNEVVVEPKEDRKQGIRYKENINFTYEIPNINPSFKFETKQQQEKEAKELELMMEKEYLKERKIDSLSKNI